jgi:hypothetical protein
MKMRVAALAALPVLLPAVAASARSVERCPTLPPDSGLEWSYREGPDFDVCYARHSAGKADAFGIYLGFHPSFDPTKGHEGGEMVAGKEVVWHRGFGNCGQSQSPVWQTVLALGPRHEPYAPVAHSWVDASEELRLRLYLTILECIVFKKGG